MNGHSAWYEHGRDVLRPSNAFSEVLFVLRGEGEEKENTWKRYYLGGRMQEAPARVEYPPFDPADLMDSDFATS